MLYCKNCKVSIRTNHDRCPLCQGVLIGEKNKEDVFPLIKKAKYASKQIVRWFNFFCVMLTVICLVINRIWTPDSRWSWFVIAGIVCVWLFLAVGIYKRKNLMKNAMWQLVLLSLGAVIWDYATGFHGWSVDYVIPIASMGTMLAVIMIAILRKSSSHEYMIYFLMSGAYGIIPLILILTDVVRNTPISIICVGCSVIFLAALIIFQGRIVKEELYRKFHI